MDGDWNLRGCRWDDPSRLKTVQDVVDLIHKVGFLSLFSVEIPGMSMEEHVPASTWWTDDEDSDPWSWRMQIAKRDDIAYGKFFERKAGFIPRCSEEFHVRKETGVVQ